MNRLKCIKRREPLFRHCALGIGGPARYFAEPINENELLELVSVATSNQIPYIIVGEGTNTLFDDSGYPGLVVKIGRYISDISFEMETVDVQAGAWVPGLARQSQTMGLSGIEHIVGIPGTFGGLIVMNGGSLRHSIAESIQSVRALLPNGTIATLTRGECEFGYRTSIFKKDGLIVLSAKLVLQSSSASIIRRRMLEILSSRRRKFPRKIPNCGSVFKSDPKTYASFGSPGAMIEGLGLKGWQVGGVQISKLHGNFFLNVGSATAEDYLSLINFVQGKVYSEYGICLQPELVFQSASRPSSQTAE